MPFIGKQPQAGAYSKLDAITTSATATYNLTLGGSAYFPSSANHLLVSLNGVLQAPQDSFTVSGSQITFASALTSADSIDFIMALGDVLDIGTPSAGATVPGAFNVQDNFTVGDRVTIEPAARAGVNEIKSYNNSASSYMELHLDASSFRFYDSANGTHDSSTEVLRVNDFGLSFDAGSNYLDDYEEGTWTPDFVEDSNPSFSITGYDYRGGSYQKIGKYVYFFAELRSQGHTGATGNTLLISGLPFTPNLTSSNGHFNNRRYGDFKVIGGTGAPTGEAPQSVRVTDNNTNIMLFQFADITNLDEIAAATTNMLRSSADTHIFVSGSYITD